MRRVGSGVVGPMVLSPPSSSVERTHVVHQWALVRGSVFLFGFMNLYTAHSADFANVNAWIVDRGVHVNGAVQVELTHGHVRVLACKG